MVAVKKLSESFEVTKTKLEEKINMEIDQVCILILKNKPW